MKWIEIVVGFSCNCRCRVCPSSLQAAATVPMSADEIAHWLQEGKRQGAENVWFGGGEPTLHPDLLRSIELARRLGYRRIRIQTNAMRFAYRPFVRRIVDAGANEFSVSFKGGSRETHDSVTQNPESFTRLAEGVCNLVAEGTRVEGDILMTRASLPELAGCVETFGRQGISRFAFWLLSLHGSQGRDLAPRLPRLGECVPQLEAAFAAADQLGVGAFSLHTPPCVLPPERRDRYLPSSRLDLVVVTPGSAPFRVEESPMEGGSFLEACTGCSRRSDCLGPRADYLDVHGSAEFVPILPTKGGTDASF